MVPEGFQTDEVENRAAGERDNQGNRKNQFIQANEEQRKTAKQKAARDAAAKRLREENEERQERERQILGRQLESSRLPLLKLAGER